MKLIKHIQHCVVLSTIAIILFLDKTALAQSFYDTGAHLDKKAKMQGTLSVIIATAIIIGIIVFFVKKARKK